jgi:hypothetical protein
MQVDAATPLAGMNHIRPSVTVAKRKSHRWRLKCLTIPFQLWFPP